VLIQTFADIILNVLLFGCYKFYEDPKVYFFNSDMKIPDNYV